MKRYLLLFLKYAFPLIALIGILGISACTQNSPYPEDMWTRNIYPGATLTFDLGSPTYIWHNLYVENINGMLSGNVTGTGVIDTIVKWTSPSTIGNSDITDTATAVNILDNLTATGYVDLIGCNITYVPLGGNIQTYVNNAVAGDTLILASGQYIITSTITINKQLNIYGQGNAGFLTSPVTAGHGTLISSTTNAIVAFQINSSNVRIANLSLQLTGNASTGINTANNLTGIVFTNVDVIVTCAGLAQGFTVYGSNIVMRDLTFYIRSTNTASSGFWFWNDVTTTQNAVADCFNVTGTVVGAGTYAYAFVCENIADNNTLTLNLSNSVCKALAGTPLDVGVASISTTTSNSIVNAYMSTFDGENYDAYQTNTNQLNLGGSVLVNNRIFGTVTYRATMAAGSAVLGSTLTIGSGYIIDSSGAIDLNSDLMTDRWLLQDSNTFLGIDVAGAGTLVHTGGLEGYDNTGYGYTSLYAITKGKQNTAIGSESASAITEGSYNTALGYEALKGVTTGNGNTAIGRLALCQIDTGSFNTAVGEDALYKCTGSYNVAVGLFAGHENVGGSSNVFLGSRAGYSELGSNKLYIDNSDIATPLIYGDFSTNDIIINGDLTANGNFNYGIDAGASDSYACTITGITAYVAGMPVYFNANTANTGACTLDINGLGVIALKIKGNTTDPEDNWILADQIVHCVYDGTVFQVMNPDSTP